MISLTDITGRSILEKHIERSNPNNDKAISIDISSLKVGIYLIELKTKESQQVLLVK